jgi:hypothetical protein
LPLPLLLPLHNGCAQSGSPVLSEQLEAEPLSSARLPADYLLHACCCCCCCDRSQSGGPVSFEQLEAELIATAQLPSKIISMPISAAAAAAAAVWRPCVI